MAVALGVVMDPISTIKVEKDSTLAMLLEAQRRDWDLWYMEQADLRLADGEPFARMRELEVRDDLQEWYRFGADRDCALAELNVILMRKDPPFDMEYIYTTYLLEQAEARGCLIVNGPRALRDANEKLYTAWFPQCCPPTLVSRREGEIRRFLAEHSDVIVKPLGGMGGTSVFRIKKDDPNTGVILETLTDHGRRYTMAQRFIPEIRAGDKRILVVAGEPVPYALARVPRAGETRGNLAAGGTGHGVPLDERDRWIVEQLAPRLVAAGIWFAGLDVIGEFLTEINVTSPTCIRELDRIYGINISAQLMDRIEEKLVS
jgi:glutathione synthase